MADLSVLAFEIPLPVVTLGSLTGMTYGLLAVGLVVVYRTSRIINFAHGAIGAFGAAMLFTATDRWHIPYYLAVPLGLGAAGAAAILTEVAVVRRLRNAPRVMSIVATLGVAQFLLAASTAFNPQSGTGGGFPKPPGLPEFTVGALLLTQPYVGMMIFGPIAVAALTVFLRRSRYGVGIRCASANPEAARMAGISAARMSALAWALAGVLSALTAILVIPARGLQTGEAFGPGLLLRALAAGVLARMHSMPVALGAGIGLGVIEQVLRWNYPLAPGLVEVVLYVIVLVALLVQRSVGGRDEEKGTWASVQGWRPLPDAVASLAAVRNAPRVLAVMGIVLAALLPAVLTHSAAVTLTAVMCFTIVGVSVGVVTGLNGQLTLGQFGVAAIGAVVSYHVSTRTGSFALAFLYAALAAAGVSLVIGLPALRIRGLMLTVTTIGFAVVVSSWLLQQSFALGDGVDPGRPIVFDEPVNTGKEYYYFVLVVLVLVMLLAHNIRRGGLGRLMVAVRENEDNARAFTVRARVVKLEGFMLAGFIAGVGGAAYGHLLSRLTSSAFPVSASIDVVAMVVIGGMSLLVGPLLGALYILALPTFLDLDAAGLAATQLGWLVLILYLPGGLAQAIEPIRRRFIRRAARRAGIDFDGEEEAIGAAAAPLVALPAIPGRNGVRRSTRRNALEARHLKKSFGGIHAVNDVSFTVGSGEILGLIGPNGAGKTTTFELLGGFTHQDAGQVFFEGEDVSGVAPEQRARLGLIRSFQDAALFPTMTVLECCRLAFERVDPTSAAKSLLGLGGSEAKKDRMARELVGAMGLHGYQNKRILELSTGTRRITEIACLMALQPSVLLLDEPSSGIAQRETEALGVLLHRIRDEYDLTMVVIEHDIPLIMGLSNRIVAMDAGRVLVTGTPEVVRQDRAVVEAYLGGSVEAIERSGGTPASVPEP